METNGKKGPNPKNPKPKPRQKNKVVDNGGFILVFDWFC